MFQFIKRLFGKKDPPTKQASGQFTEMEGSGIVIQVPKHSKNVDSDYQITIESTHHAHIRSRNGKTHNVPTKHMPQPMRSTHHHYHCNPAVVLREQYQRQDAPPAIPGNYSVNGVADYRAGSTQIPPPQSIDTSLELLLSAWFASLSPDMQEHYRRQIAQGIPPTALPQKPNG